MDVRTALTLQQKARKNARAFAGGCPGGMNVNDMRYSCQGFMGQVAGGPFPCDPSGPCQFTHCMPCDPACGTACPTVAGGIAPYAEEGPCAFTHCIGEVYHQDNAVAGASRGVGHRGRGGGRRRIAGGHFPPTCDPCAPCVYQSTCTPCDGPQRPQRWGNQFTPDDFGGRVCFRPCPPNPCLPEVPPVDQRPEVPPKRVPPVSRKPPKRMPPGKKPPRITTHPVPGPKCPPYTSCCVVLAGDYLILKCEDTTHPWHGMDVTLYGKCYGANGNSICEISWTDECGTHTLALPLCLPDRPGVPTVPPVITAPGRVVPPGVPTVPPVLTAPGRVVPPGVPTVPPVVTSRPPYIPVPVKPGSPTPRLALAGGYSGRVRTPSNGVGRR